MDAARGADRARRGRDDPLGHRARVHPLRGDPLATTCSTPARMRRRRRRGLQRLEGKTLRRRGRRRAQHPLQRVRAALPGLSRPRSALRRPARRRRLLAGRRPAARPARAGRGAPSRRDRATRGRRRPRAARAWRRGRRARWRRRRRGRSRASAGSSGRGAGAACADERSAAGDANADRRRPRCA